MVRGSTFTCTSLGATQGDGAASGGASGSNQRRPRKKPGPRNHVPVAESGVGDDGLVVDPSASLVAPAATSTLPEPSFEDRQRFGRIMEDVLGAEKEEELPALVTKHIDFLLSVDVTRLTNDLIRWEECLAFEIRIAAAACTYFECWCASCAVGWLAFNGRWLKLRTCAAV